MIKNFNKKVTTILAAGILATSFIGAMPVQAANVSNKDIRGVYVNGANSTFKDAAWSYKENSTKVYLLVTSSPNMYTQVQVHGSRSTGTYYNETKGTTATVTRTVESSITNYVFEHRAAGAKTVACKLKLRSNSNTAGEVSGVWSPDSTKNYTVVNK